MNDHMKENVSKIMNQPVSRLDFLKQVGAGVAALAGAGAVIKAVGAMGSSGQTQATSGYGASVYGGNTASAKTAR